MRKKSVLFVINGLYGGGAEKVFQTLLNNLDREKYDITVYSVIKQAIDRNIYQKPFDYGYFYNAVDENESALKKFQVKLKNKVKLWIYQHCSPELFYRFHIKKKYDVEVAFIEGYATRIISGSPNKESKKIAWVHIDLFQNHWTKIAYRDFEEEKSAYEKYNHILGVSKDVSKAFSKKFDITENVGVQYNPVDETEILRKATQTNGIKKVEGKMNFITIGRLVEQKGYDRLVRIAKQLKNDNYDFFIRILGDGEQREKLQEYINENGLKDYVKLEGFVNNPYPFIQMADAFVCSSRSEGFSTVITEALILGKPVITTDCAGMQELFGGYECGVICENDEYALLEEMRRIINHQGNLNRYVNQVNVRAQFFKLRNRIKELERIF